MKRLLIGLILGSLSVLSSSVHADCIEVLEREIDEHTLSKKERITIYSMEAATIAGATLLNPVVGAIWGAGVIGTQIHNEMIPVRMKRSVQIIKDAYEYKQTNIASKILLKAVVRYNKENAKIYRQLNLNKYIVDASTSTVVNKIIDYNEQGKGCILPPSKLMNKVQ